LHIFQSIQHQAPQKLEGDLSFPKTLYIDTLKPPFVDKIMSSVCSDCLQLAATISAIATGENTSAGAEQPIIHNLSPENEKACKLCTLLRLKVGKYQYNEVEVWPSWGNLNEFDTNLRFRDVPKGSQFPGLLAIAVRPLRIPSKDPETEETRRVSVLLQSYCLWGESTVDSNTLK
jgi:hypothetical protein